MAWRCACGHEQSWASAELGTAKLSSDAFDRAGGQAAVISEGIAHLEKNDQVHMGAGRKRRPRGGRPPAGFRPGERVRDYPQLSVRIPAVMKMTLSALGVMQSKPQWRIVCESIECLVRSLSESDQRKLKELIKRRHR